MAYSCSEAICLFIHRYSVLSLLVSFVISISFSLTIYSLERHITSCFADLMLILHEDFEPLNLTNMKALCLLKV